MTVAAKLIIESAFRDSILQVCKRYTVAIHQMSLKIRFMAKGKQRLELYEKDLPKEEISFNNLMHQKMVGLRFNVKSLKSLFDCIHHAFMLEKKCVEPQRICLLFYQSKKFNSPCIGILYDNSPIKSLRVVDIFDAMDIGNEQLN